jgi:hypothetical protein
MVALPASLSDDSQKSEQKRIVLRPLARNVVMKVMPILQGFFRIAWDFISKESSRFSRGHSTKAGSGRPPVALTALEYSKHTTTSTSNRPVTNNNALLPRRGPLEHRRCDDDRGRCKPRVIGIPITPSITRPRIK